MNFCYVDESGLQKGDRVVVLVGVVVDAHRMHVSKNDWQHVLKKCSEIAGRPVKELHTRHLYRGQKEWENVTPPIRVAVIDVLLEWFLNRKHGFTFGAVDADELKKLEATEPTWFAPTPGVIPGSIAALHIFCTIQKLHQAEKKNKGHTVVVMDGDTKPSEHVCEWSCSPPPWTDDFYDRPAKKEPFDQLVDIPYYGDSRRVLLLQMSDLLAYLIRQNTMLQMGLADEKYEGEVKRMANWADMAMKMAYPSSARWRSRGRSPAEDLFLRLAPEPLRGR